MTRLLVTTGAESSGKTTLARNLSAALGAPLVHEASRDYLNARLADDPLWRYGEPDLLAIAQLQRSREREALSHEPQHLVCDTDLLVIVLWSEVRYGRCAPALRQLFDDSLTEHPRHYLLCVPDIPWEPDPLRENPHDRNYLHALYADRLAALDLSWLQVEGDPATRLERVLTTFDLV